MVKRVLLAAGSIPVSSAMELVFGVVLAIVGALFVTFFIYRL